MVSSNGSIAEGHSPSVFIVMPILNEARYIASAIESILSQDYEPLEVVVYDGGSTDGTIDILKQYPVKVIVRPGMGQMEAINHAWQNSSADFVTWQAGDDRLKPGAISRLTRELISHPEVGFVYADADCIDGDNRFLAHLSPGQLGINDLLFNNDIIQQASLIRRSVLAQSGMMDESLRFAADSDLWLRIALKSKLLYLPFTAAEYRVHAGSEDAQNRLLVGEATLAILGRFFARKDLSPEIQDMRRHAFAGAHILQCRMCGMEGRRKEGWRAIFQVARYEPRSLFSKSALYAMGRLIVPFRMKPWTMFRIMQRLRRRRIGAA